ncbi:G1/S-specific cyclin-E1 [Syngnathus scovelli]|uniref:G1/S-specific cyclin-E1 n=1 Tax=Syngnathus scovelli TaxID=161590 RepID=UPI0021103E3B|nr:G1/S-specific cyclin-E1 [Syngnathus scovelli]XP_049573598.1 G1/S-specific cyclin-E1 [Syngnathus scovelli]
MLASREESEQEAECVASEAANVGTLRPRKRKADVAIHLQDVDEDTADMTKKKLRDSEAAWRSEEDAYASPRCWRSTLAREDEHQQQITLINVGFPHYNLTNVCATPVHCAPLPALCWASKDVVWNNMLAKDKTYTRNVNMMAKHPHLQPKMRAVLLDWLMEVSEVYKLHRETYHLAQDYFDRFMATQSNVFKTTLQLIGISCLFIAAKVEEMYPPKVHLFAYVTDEACTEDDILSMEIIIMKELKWSLSPQTPVSWLNVYMQVAYLKESDQLLIPKYPQATFVQIAELLDVCMLDMRCLEFSNGILAASALFHFSSLELVENVSALKRAELEECVRWMVPFAMALRESGGSPMKTFAAVAAEDMHNIQTYAPYLTWLEKASSYQDADMERHRGGCHVPSGVLTPPLSSEKTDQNPNASAATLQVPPRMREAQCTLAP